MVICLPMDAAADGAFWEVEHFCDFYLAEVAEGGEGERLAEFFGELVDEGVHRAFHLLMHGGFFWAG